MNKSFEQLFENNPEYQPTVGATGNEVLPLLNEQSNQYKTTVADKLRNDTTSLQWSPKYPKYN